MYLSYSGFKKYLECPLQYYHQYIAKTPLPEPDNRVGMLFGSTIGLIFEEFYTHKVWEVKNPVSALRERAKPAFDRILAEERRRGGVFDYKGNRDYKNHQDVLQDVLNRIPAGVQTIRRHWLVGSDAQAEVKLDNKFRGHTLGGRLDFLMHRAPPCNDLVILDGKGSKHRDAYVSADQLYWYSMLYRSHHRAIPDRVGFIFWKFEGDEAVDWFPSTKEKIDEIQDAALTAISNIEKAKKHLPTIAFGTKPTVTKCKLCPYNGLCPDGQTILSEAKPDMSGGGVDDFGM